MLTQAMATVAKVTEMRQQGATWKMIGMAWGCDGKTAKARAKKLARQAQADAVRGGAS